MSSRGKSLAEEQSVWRVLDALELYGKPREEVEPIILEFEREVQKRTENNIIRALNKK